MTKRTSDPTAPEGEVTNCDEHALGDLLKVGDALLSRLNAPLMGVCLSLLRKGVPARIEGRDIGKQLVGIVRKLRAKLVPNFIDKITKWGDKMKKRLGTSKRVEDRLGQINDQVDTLIAVAEGGLK